MIALTILVLGWFGFNHLAIDLLPHLIYPEIAVRVTQSGATPLEIEDQITRPLEESLAITEGLKGITSTSSSGRSSVDLTFPYGTDIDAILRDASTRLDRAKRLLPTTIDPPTIYKRDPSQIPVAELIISSNRLESSALREWIEYHFARYFLTLEGVAATEIGGGQPREVVIVPDPLKLVQHHLTLESLVTTLKAANQQQATGLIRFPAAEIESHLNNRFTTLQQIEQLPLPLSRTETIPLNQIAQIWPQSGEERVRVRLNGEPGIKLSIQKQPEANSVAVVAGIRAKLAWLAAHKALPAGVQIDFISEQASFVEAAIKSTQMAALSAIGLAMGVIFLFLGDWRRTLVIGTAIPFAILITFLLMALAGLTLNIMSLGGLALGIGILLDNTIVMLENIFRHQLQSETGTKRERAAAAAHEIQSAIIASTTTNLAALLPFLLIGGLIGLLFQELILTIVAALIASLLLALTLVPALSSTLHAHSTTHWLQRWVDRVMHALQEGFVRLLRWLLRYRLLQLLLVGGLSAALYLTTPRLFGGIEQFLPPIDNGEATIRISADAGVALDAMDRAVQQVEALLLADPVVATTGTIVGGLVFGRTTLERSNLSTINVSLIPIQRRSVTVQQWVDHLNRAAAKLPLVGFSVRSSVRGVRGIRLGSGDEDLTLRIQGDHLDTLAQLADQLSSELKKITGLNNISHSAEDRLQQIEIRPDLAALNRLGLTVEGVSTLISHALRGVAVGSVLLDERPVDLTLRLALPQQVGLDTLRHLVIGSEAGSPMTLDQVTTIQLTTLAAEVRHTHQQRMVEITAALTSEARWDRLAPQIQAAIDTLKLPENYLVTDGGAREEIERGEQRGTQLVLLAIFLVFVVMAVQYESLRNPLIILAAMPFTLIGVALGLDGFALPLSMPVILGTIMLTGIVVNNAILLVEYFELGQQQGLTVEAAILEAARLRLRPILMTTLTTILGMLPLALSQGEGAEMLQPLAATLISGLSLSLPVTLLLIPLLYHAVGRRHPRSSAISSEP